MPTVPQPPQPPVAPAPARPGSNVLTIVLLLLALIVVVSGLVLWGGLKFLSHNIRVNVQESKVGKEVSVETPMGAINVKKEVNEAQLGLPIYPGAVRLKGQDSATVNMSFGGADGFRLVVGKFQTSAPIDKVRGFYHDRLGGEVTKFTQKDGEGKTVFEIKHDKLEKVVALKATTAGTEIDLVNVNHGKEEGN